MTTTQLFLILGTIWIAPHVSKYHGQMTGCIILLVTACKELGWI